jgi:tetratricopeptide (TPR) repeat protein
MFDETIAVGRELGRPVRVIQNYSTLALRDIFDLDEARRRTEESLSQTGWSGFNMPRVNALADRVQTELLAGEFGKVELAWPTAWEEATTAQAWQRWLVSGRLAAARAERALRTEGSDAAIEWAHRAIEMATPVRRRKYEAVGRTVLGLALTEAGRPDEAVGELRLAAEISDALGSPPARWQARVALGHTLYAMGDDDGAAEAFRKAGDIVREVAAGLAPERATRFLDAEPVRELLRVAGAA